MSRRRALAALLAVTLCMGAASDPGERLKDPGQEARARHLFGQFRCVVCQNESIDDSQAELAHDLRRIVRQQVAQGSSDAQIKTFMVDRYGEFILLKPRFSAGNSVLWLAPFLIVLAGGALFALRARRPSRFEAALTPEEEERLSALELDAAVPHPGSQDRRPGVQ
jgi:cytochrome c-type biogenesis protein CcmH